MVRDLRRLIHDNAAELQRLHRRVRESFAHRAEGPQARRAWDQACVDFHSSYDRLAFPGGYQGACERLLDGDPQTMEAALAFLELRPYFFRSGYMRKRLLRYAKRAPFSPAQALRLRAVLAREAQWRALKRAAPALALDELFQIWERRGLGRAKD